MEQKESKHIVKKTIKIIAWCILGLSIILIGLRLSLKTSFVQNFVKDKVVEIASNSLQPKLSIGSIKGDLWDEIELTDIQIGVKDSVAHIDTLYASYNLLSIINGSFTVNKLKFTKAAINIREIRVDEDSSVVFNVQELVVPDTTSEESSSTFGFNIEEIVITNSMVTMASKSILPDSTLTLKEIEMVGDLSLGEEIEGSLKKLSFQIQEGRLPQNIAFNASVEYNNQTITLQDLVVNTGKSLLQVQGFADLKDSVINVNADLNPLSFNDVKPYIEAEIPNEELELGLQLKGNADNLEIKLSGKGSFIGEIEAIANIQFSDTPQITNFELKGKNFDIAKLTNDSVDVKTGVFQFTADGNIGADYEQANISWDLGIDNIRYEKYVVKRVSGNGSLIKGKVRANVKVITPANEQLITKAEIQNVFNENTSWEIGFNLKELNAANWAEETPKTNVTLSGFAAGSGFALSDEIWKYSISNGNSRIADYKSDFIKSMKVGKAKKIEIATDTIDKVLIYGTLNKDFFQSTASIQVDKSKLDVELTASSYLEGIPTYKYKASTTKLDASSFSFTENFPTSINMKIEGTGSGLNMENMYLDGSINVDTSFVNGSQIQFLKQTYSLDKGILVISDAELKSGIADAAFSGRKNLMDEKDPENILSFDLDIKNTQPFASLANLEILQITGSLSADIKENEEGFLECNARLDLQDIIIDDMFVADGISGNADATLKEKNEGSFEFDINKPRIFGTQFQDILVSTQSITTEDSLYGRYSIVIQDDKEGKIENEGDYEVLLDSMHLELTMDKLNIVAEEEGLNLQNTFNISFKDGVLRTDSLELTSPNGAFLSLSIPYADSLKQNIWFVGESFDFGILQEIMFNERYIDGVLNGNVTLNKTQDKLDGNGKLELQNISYKGTEVDIISLEFKASNNRLISKLGMIWDNEEMVTGSVDIPLDLSDSETFSDDFYEQKVNGKLDVKPIELIRFESILTNFGITGTKGLISFNSSLSGTAGKPNLEGALKVLKPTLSDVPLDSLTARFDYSQEKENIIVAAELKAAKQKAADIDINFPFSYNFKTLELNMVDKDKPVSATIKTTEFNLAVFNDFLDKDLTKNLKGSLNGELDLKGTENQITADGFFDLTNSSFEVPILGIKVDRVKSRIEFEDGKIVLKELKANSGKGDFSAKGDINLEGLYPTNIDIQARANQFKAANTSDYNLVVDLNSKLKGPFFTPKATGRLAVKNGFIVLDNFGDKSVEEVQLEGEEAMQVSFYDSLAIGMEFAIERNFFVRNRRYLDMELEISGQLDAQKETNGELSLFGSLNGDGGYLRPLGKRFELDEAKVTFSGPAANPDLNIRSAYVPLSRKGEQEVTLYYIIKGTVENPIYSFESNPTMEKQDIICYTVFNRPCYALDSWQNALTTQGGSSPTDLLAGAVIDEIEALATRELGVDVVQIDNTRVGNETGTTVKTGWYLNDRTFFAIVNEITSSDPKTLFILEYALSKTWDLIITEGEDQNQRGIDFRWQFDY